MRKPDYLFAFITLLTVAVTAACREKFVQPDVTVNTNYLVVEGYIDTGADSTVIKLSRTVTLSTVNAYLPESKAIVTIESAGGSVYTLPATTVAGVYGAPSLGLDPTKQYHVKIKTTDGKTYQSDFVSSNLTPPIDSVYWKANGANLSIYADTHDAVSNTRYYRYNFDETFQYTAAYLSIYVATNNTIVPRDLVNNNIYNCWHTLAGTGIITASSAKLSQNVISQNVVNSIPLNSQKVAIEYSINVKQYAISEEAYTFWTNLKKNTESLGSIFDAQPSQLQGNVHCLTNPNEPVFGYISAGTMKQKRIFVYNKQLPIVPSVDRYGCSLDTAYFVDPVTKANDVILWLYTQKMLIGNVVFDTLTRTKLIGYTSAQPFCMDCSLQGGKTKPPAFWQ